jgi:CRISPR/Cas system-associated exonuclease Cas4 (RecB family)
VEAVLAEKPSFSWSISRHDCFATCRRRYFYSYYAAPVDPEIQRLKRLSALPLWTGSVVHETIEKVLHSFDRMPSDVEQEALVREAVHSRMLSDWRESEAGSERFRLFEHEYVVPVDPEDKKIAVGTVMRSMRNFFKSETLRQVFAAGRERVLSLEDLVSFKVGETSVFLRMDLAYRSDDGRVVIVDWKTGRSEGRFNEIQLAGYALCAVEQGWVKEPEELVTELAYLAVPRYVRRSVDRAKIAHARSFIAKSAGSMKSLLLDPLLNVGRLEDFAMIDKPRVCRRCNYRRLCFPRADEAQPPLAAAAPPAGI